MNTQKLKIDIKEGQLFWLLWAAFARVEHDCKQAMNFDQALKSFLPGCTNYDMTLLGSTLLSDMNLLIKNKKLRGNTAERLVLMASRERILEELRKREIPNTSETDHVG